MDSPASNSSREMMRTYHLQRALNVDEKMIQMNEKRNISQTISPEKPPQRPPRRPTKAENDEIRKLRREVERLRDHNAKLNDKAIHCATLASQALHEKARMIGERADVEWELVRSRQHNKAYISEVEGQNDALREQVERLRGRLEQLDREDRAISRENRILQQQLVEQDHARSRFYRQEVRAQAEEHRRETMALVEHIEEHRQEAKDLLAHIDELVAEREEQNAWAGFGSPEWEALREKDSINAATTRQIRVLIAEQNGEDIADLQVERLGDAETELLRLLEQVSAGTNAMKPGHESR